MAVSRAAPVAPSRAPSRWSGKHCESGDIVAHDAPLRPGPLVTSSPASGAYHRSMASNQRKLRRGRLSSPGQGRGGEGSFVRRETEDDLLALDVGCRRPCCSDCSCLAAAGVPVAWPITASFGPAAVTAQVRRGGGVLTGARWRAPGPASGGVRARQRASHGRAGHSVPPQHRPRSRPGHLMAKRCGLGRPAGGAGRSRARGWLCRYNADLAAGSARRSSWSVSPRTPARARPVTSVDDAVHDRRSQSGGPSALPTWSSGRRIEPARSCILCHVARGVVTANKALIGGRRVVMPVGRCAAAPICTTTRPVSGGDPDPAAASPSRSPGTTSGPGDWGSSHHQPSRSAGPGWTRSAWASARPWMRRPRWATPSRSDRRHRRVSGRGRHMAICDSRGPGTHTRVAAADVHPEGIEVTFADIASAKAMGCVKRHYRCRTRRRRRWRAVHLMFVLRRARHSAASPPALNPARSVNVPLAAVGEPRRIASQQP
jgi:hypothetical protein